MIPSAVFFGGDLYVIRGYIAHLRLTDEPQPLPAFLRRIGSAAVAGRDSQGRLAPDSDSQYAAYSIAGTPASTAIVLDATLVGDKHVYRVFIRYARK